MGTKQENANNPALVQASLSGATGGQVFLTVRWTAAGC